MPLTVVNDRGHVMTTFERGTSEAPLQEFILRVPGYDHRHGPDAKPGGGIHSEEIVLGVRRPHPEDPTRAVALALTVVTGVYPMTVPAHVANELRPRYPWATDLTLHVELAAGSYGLGYFTENNACCFFAKPAFCTRPFTTSLALDALIGDGTKVGIRAWPLERWGAPTADLKEQFWIDLRAKLDRLLRDPDFFNQPDEPPDLVAARKVLEVAQKIHDQWTQNLEHHQKRVADELAKFKESRKP